MPRHTQPRMRRAASASALAITAAVALAAVPSADAASIWTPVASGTSDTITGLAYRSDKTVFGTSTGKLYTLAGGLRASFPGQGVVDLSLNPSGTTAVAILDSGKAVRSTDGGTTWGSPVQLQTYNFSGCQSSPDTLVGLVNLPSAPTSVHWASDTTAYVTASALGSVIRSTNSGATWSEISRKSNQTCTISTGSEPLTDSAPVVGSNSIYFTSQYFGNTWFSSDGLASTPSDRAESVNCYTQRVSLAVDSGDGTRLASGSGCSDYLQLAYSENGGQTFTNPTVAPEGTPVNGINDTDFTGGTIIWAGKGGDIFTSRDGRTAYSQKVEGADATRDWRAVSAYSSTNAAVAGVGGALYVTSAASNIPDLIAPSGTINDPGTVTAGVAKSFSANLLDNAGGSGIDPASIRWSATGIPDASGNPATITFPSAGFYTLTASFKDLAGNSASISRSVMVGSPAGSGPGSGSGSGTTPGGLSTGTIVGASFTLQGPTQCVPAGSTFVATMSMRRIAIKNNRIVKLKRVDFFVDGKRVKIDRTAPFKQTLAIKGAVAGSVHTLKATGYVKVKRGKSPKRNQSVKFAVCG